MSNRITGDQMSTIMRRGRTALCALALSLVAVAGVPPPAAAAQGGIPGPFKIRNQAYGVCLDASPRGTSDWVYVNVCDSEDTGQRWGWYNGGWLKNLARNQCVAATPFREASLGGCSTDSDRQWTHQNLAIVHRGTDWCLEPTGRFTGDLLKIQPCQTSTLHGWTVTYW